MKILPLACAPLLLLAVTVAPVAAAPKSPVVPNEGMVDLVPHRAVYAMSLGSTQSGSGIAGVSGAMSYQFGDTCDGWVVENTTLLDFAYNEGAAIATTWTFSTWEAKDGSQYRFRVQNLRNGEIAEQIDGRATMASGRNEAGRAVFTQPDQLSIALPRNTLFPTQHTLKLITAAQAGETPIFNRVVFDGASAEGAFEVNAVISKHHPATGPASAGPQPVSSPLLDTSSWPMHLAFYPTESRQELPEYEVGLRYHLNGVAQELVQDYGNFTVRGRLEKLEILPKPQCGDAAQ